jgi:hypothetical protein
MSKVLTVTESKELLQQRPSPDYNEGRRKEMMREEKEVSKN